MPRMLVAFFASGFAALLCQIVWQRMLGLFAGSETVSAALVVGAFLAGLGLGSLLGAWIADRLTPARALRGFALCELGIALCAVISRPVLQDGLALGLAGQVEAPWAVFALCFAALVVPTTLMGASLPLLARAVATRLDTAAARIGALYGANTIGAGLGALVGGFLILGSVGFVAALWIAAGLNLLAAMLALGVRPGTEAAAAAPPVPMADGAGGLGQWCLLVFLSGYVIVALEIVWLRLLGQVTQFHAYLFPAVLGTFLLADGAGIAVATRLLRRAGDPRRGFFLAQGAGFVMAAALILGLWIAARHAPLATMMAVDDWRFATAPFLLGLGLVALVVAPPAFLIGMTFPFVQRAVQRDLAQIGARTGWVQVANIAGNAAGSVLTGLVTLHFWGTAGTMVLLAAVSLGLLLVWLRGAGPGPARRAGAGLAVATAVCLLAFPGNATFWRRLHGPAPDSFAAFAEDRSGVAFFREAPADPARDPGKFFIAGHGQGTIPFLPIHILLGAIGPLIHPDPARVLVIGVGSAGTPWGALVSPATRELRAVELVRPVLTTLAAITTARPEGAIAALARDPRVRLEAGDGRQAILRGDARYDVIEADAILPETAQSGLLYSAEFLEQVRARLAPGGLYVQWAPTRRVVDTFVATFPHAVLLAPTPVLVGSNEPLAFDHAALLAQLAGAEVLAHARRGNPNLEALAPMVAGVPVVWAPGIPRPAASLTDLFPRDEFFLNNPTRATPPQGLAAR